MTAGAGQEPGRPIHPGYLADVEASHITFVAAPRTVFVCLARWLPEEQARGQQVRRTLMELQLGEAAEVHRALGAAIAKAAAMASQPSHVDAALLL